MGNENRPVKKFQAGGVNAALWLNETKLASGKQMASLSVTLDRRYKDNDGNWKSSPSFRLNDVPKAMLVLQKAYEYMATKKSEGNNDEMASEEVVM